MTALAATLAALLDHWLGEPRRAHPLVAFGRLAGAIERRLYRPERLQGALAWLLAVVPLTALAAAIASFEQGRLLFEVLVLFLCLGAASLAEHAAAVANALETKDLPAARRAVGGIVSRDTAELDEAGVAAAAVESVLENGNDAVFGCLFWFVVAGAPGAVLYRLANTLDAMWGYRNARYNEFGWAAARVDDLLNFVPARLTALGYALLGHFGSAIACWRTQARQWKSPNAGAVMAAGAGALELRLGGPARYHGIEQRRPVLGAGRMPAAVDVGRTVGLVRRTLILWLVVIGVLDVLA